MSEVPDADGMAEGIVPEIAQPPIITRVFEPAPWHRPRKQYIRKHQWNHEIVELIVKKRPENADRIVRVLGLPSSEYLDLLSMRAFCEDYDQRILYLGFDASHVRTTEGPATLNLYGELQARRMIESSSFVHPSSRLVPDLFEKIGYKNSVAWNALEPFGEFDVINLDICGCIVRPEKQQATEVLSALAELMNWQSVRRLTPWLLFITTFASPGEINLSACEPLITAVRENAEDSADFRDQLKATFNFDSDELVSLFTVADAKLPAADQFIRIFALALGKWLSRKLKQPIPPSFVSMLPSYCFSHKDIPEPHLLSLAYLIEPAPSPGLEGVSTASGQEPDRTQKYTASAKRMIGKSFGVKDLDQLMTQDGDKRKEMEAETEVLLTDCGFNVDEVRTFLDTHR